MLKFNHSSFLAISVSVLMLLGAGCSSDGSASDEPDCTESDRCSASDSSSSVDEELEPEEYTDSDDESDTVVEPVGEHESEDDVIEEPVSDDEPDPVTDPVDPGSEPVAPGSEPVDPGSEPVDPGTEQPVIDPKPEPQPDPVYCNQEIIKTFKLKRKGAELPIGESQALSMKIVTDARTYKVSDFPCDLVWSSSDTKIATISSAGKVTAVAAGHATVTVTTKDKKLSSSIKIHVLDLDNLKRTITADMVEISGFRLEHRTAAAQGFDFGTSPYLFIAQNGSSGKAGGAQHINAIQKIDPAKQDLTGAKQNPSGIMNIKYAGHAQNINWEKSGNQEYIWVSNYGTIKAKDGDNRYIKSQTISRIPWTENTKATAIAPDETTENYYYPKMVNIQPILNLDYNFMGFWAQNSDATKFYIKIFYLGEAKALTPVSKKLPYAVTWGGGSSPDAQKTFTPTVMVKDLSQLTPVYEITYNNRDSLYTADYQQGIIANNSGVYMLWGTPKDEDKDGIYTPRARVYYITRKGKSTRYNLNFDISALKKLDISSIGYLEPEGMRMVDGVLYILYATVGANIDGKEDTSTKRIAIIKYDLAQKHN